jgi:hypothetical protein
MESVKSAILDGIKQRHGDCIVQMDPLDLCMKICVRKSPEHIIYVRPNAAETAFQCHYVHKDDMEERKCFHHTMLEEYGEEWLQHQKTRNEAIKRYRLKDPPIECRCESTEVRKWRQQGTFRLIRTVQGGMGKFAPIAIWYVGEALERIRVFDAVEGDELRTRRVKTFAEAQCETELFPRPKRPPPALPASKRNGNLFPKKRPPA